MHRKNIPSQEKPSPLNPGSHVQTKDPSVLLHVELAWHGESSTHSLTSGNVKIKIDCSLYFLLNYCISFANFARFFTLYLHYFIHYYYTAGLNTLVLTTHLKTYHHRCIHHHCNQYYMYKCEILLCYYTLHWCDMVRLVDIRSLLEKGRLRNVHIICT